MIKSFGADRFLCEGNMVKIDEAIDFYSTVSHRLHNVGVEKIVYRWQYETLPLLKATKDLESLQEIRQPFFSFMDGQDVPDGFVPPEESR